MVIAGIAFNGFDIAVLILCLISFLMAFQKGLVKELIAIVSLIAAIIATLFVWGQFRPNMHYYIDPEWLADGVLGLATFALGYMLVAFLLRNITGEDGKPSMGNRLLGGAFGAGRGLVIASMLTMIVNSGHYDKVKAGYPEAELAPFLENSTIYGSTLVPIGEFIRSLPVSRYISAAKILADGDPEGALETVKDKDDDTE